MLYSIPRCLLSTAGWFFCSSAKGLLSCYCNIIFVASLGDA